MSKENITKLYAAIFEAEKVGDGEEVLRLRSQLQVAINEYNPEPTPLEPLEFDPSPFIRDVSRKPFFLKLRSLHDGAELSDFEIAKGLSSYMTHALIEVERQQRSQEDSYRKLHLVEASALFHQYLSGADGITASTISEFVKNELSFLFESG